MSIWSWIKAGARLPIYVVRFHRIHGQSDGGAQSAGRLLIDPDVYKRQVGDLDPASLRTLTLTDQQGADVRYLLAAPADRGNSGDFYVLTDGELSGTEVSGRRVAALMHQQAAVQLYDLMNRQGAQSGAVPLTAEELAYFNDGSFFDNGRCV